jgi:hypothetical protein
MSRIKKSSFYVDFKNINLPVVTTVSNKMHPKKVILGKPIFRDHFFRQEICFSRIPFLDAFCHYDKFLGFLG